LSEFLLQSKIKQEFSALPNTPKRAGLQPVRKGKLQTWHLCANNSYCWLEFT